MRLWPAISVLAVATLNVSAQEELDRVVDGPLPLPEATASEETPSIDLQPKPTPSPAPSPLPSVEADPFARFHFFHNERVHDLRQRAWRNLFADPVHLFHFWYTSRKGITLMHFFGGRLRLGFETQRVQLPGDDQRYFDPLRAMDACTATLSYRGGICRPMYVDEGERRYAVTFRLTFD